MMYKMDMMPTASRDVHTDTFRHDAQDGHDAAGLVGMITTIFFRHDEQDGHDADGSQGCAHRTFRQDQHDDHDFDTRRDAKVAEI